MASHPLLRARDLAACGVLAAMANAPAMTATPVVTASVVVHAGHYVVAGRSFTDVDAVAQTLQASTAQAVRLDTCMPGTARSLRALAHRLRDHALYLRVLQADEPACGATPPAAVPVSTRAAGLVTADETAIDRYWAGIMP